MRRGFSILLALLFSLGPLAPALHASDDSSLPACCRRHGMHHCAMAAQMAEEGAQAQSGNSPIVSAPATCPCYPGPATLITGPAPALASGTTFWLAPSERAFTPVARPAAVCSRPPATHAGRGPPTAI